MLAGGFGINKQKTPQEENPQEENITCEDILNFFAKENEEGLISALNTTNDAYLINNGVDDDKEYESYRLSKIFEDGKLDIFEDIEKRELKGDIFDKKNLEKFIDLLEKACSKELLIKYSKDVMSTYKTVNDITYTQPGGNKKRKTRKTKNNRKRKSKRKTKNNRKRKSKRKTKQRKRKSKRKTKQTKRNKRTKKRTKRTKSKK